MTAYPFDAVIFDMDGTLTVPTLDFARIREEIGLGPGDLTALIAAMDEEGQRRAWAIIETHEDQAMLNQHLQDGALDLVRRCKHAGMRVGIVTRNARRSVDHLSRRFGLQFDSVVTREFPHIKPHPAPVLHMLNLWRVDAGRALMVGDYIHDIHSGKAAGTRTCFFHNPRAVSYADHADFVVTSMAELAAILFTRHARRKP